MAVELIECGLTFLDKAAILAAYVYISFSINGGFTHEQITHDAVQCFEQGVDHVAALSSF